MNQSPNAKLYWLSTKRPDAFAQVRGSAEYPELEGIVHFYQTAEGVYVVSNFMGLPVGTEECPHFIFAMHIHNGSCCTGTEEDPFANAGTHYNPQDRPHPEHAGDLLPLFSNRGRAWSAFWTRRFSVADILGLTVIVHANPDDFTTQPSGNAGAKIGCGVISSIWTHSRCACRSRGW